MSSVSRIENVSENTVTTIDKWICAKRSLRNSAAVLRAPALWMTCVADILSILAAQTKHVAGSSSQSRLRGTARKITAVLMWPKMPCGIGNDIGSAVELSRPGSPPVHLEFTARALPVWLRSGKLSCVTRNSDCRRPRQGAR